MPHPDLKAADWHQTPQARAKADNIRRLAEKMAIWAKFPNDEWAELEALDAATHVFADADDLHTLLTDLMHDMRMDPEGYPLTDEGDTGSGDRRYVPMDSASVKEAV